MPVATITKRIVDTAAEGFIWDDQIRGFGLKVTPAGGRIYILQYRMGGRGSPTRRYTIGKHGSPWTPELARREAKRLLGEVAADRDPAGEKRSARQAEQQRQAEAGQRTVRAIAERWLTLQQASKRRGAETGRIIDRHVLPVLGDREIGSVRRADLHELADAIVAAGHPTMAHRVSRIVKALFGWALERDLIEANPASRLKLSGVEIESRSHVLTETELRAVWTAASQLGEPHATFVKVLTLTLQRRAEVGGMRWTELDGSTWTIPAERYKSKRDHAVPLPAVASQMIETLPRVSPFVFSGRGGRPIGDFSKLKTQLDELSGVSGWRFHDLRRSGATWLQDAGFEPHAIDAVLGHSLTGVLRVYGRAKQTAIKTTALAAWADYVSGASGDRVVRLPSRQ